MNKEEVLALVQKLPESEQVDIDRLIYTLYVRRQIERGMADIEAGNVITHEEFERIIETWPELWESERSSTPDTV